MSPFFLEAGPLASSSPGDEAIRPSKVSPSPSETKFALALNQGTPRAVGGVLLELGVVKTPI